MTSIRGYADMLHSMGSLNDMQKQFLDTIRTNSRRMESLMQDVADVNKLRHTTLKTAVKMDMFKNIALMTEKAMTPTAEQLGRTLTFDIPQGLPILNTDGEMVAKALNKLVENALRYQDHETGGEVKVAARADGNQLIVTITDNGIGMTPEEMAQLGTIYFRSDNDVVRNYKGSGLGIPVAYGIIQLMGGSVTVISEPGKGSTFSVTLPGMN
jgi:signal transduction histidine kinase